MLSTVDMDFLSQLPSVAPEGEFSGSSDSEDEAFPDREALKYAALNKGKSPKARRKALDAEA